MGMFDDFIISHTYGREVNQLDDFPANTGSK